MTRLPVTAAGHVALEEELRHRIRVARPCLIQRIQQAISDEANLIENSEYQAALAEQELNETRIADLEDKLARAEIVDVSKLSGDTIKFGATVTLIDDDTGEKRIWQIVGEPEAEAKEGRISDFTDREGPDRQDQRHNRARRSSGWRQGLHCAASGVV
jgi:transcription elongation factor GreA